MESFTNKFSFPDYYNWPFFFTIQKHFETKIKQLDMWVSLIKDYCKANRIWRLSKTFFSDNLGKNTSINRKLSQEGVNLIFEYMKNKTNSLLEVGKEDYYILWKSLDEWQECFYDSVIKHRRVDSLETLDYLMYDEEIKNEEFYGMDKELMVIILQGLEAKRKCFLLKDDSGSYIGVKFTKI